MLRFSFMKLDGQVAKVENLSQVNRDQMFRLMQECYRNVDRDLFEEDLEQKKWAILVCDQGGEIQGFSTQTIIQTSVDQRAISTLFSGDTVISPDFWGKNPLFQIWGQFALSLIDQFPNQELYWFLISKGVRTYRTLPLFFHDFWPRFDCDTPGAIEKIINGLGSHSYPDHFDISAGVIRASDVDYHLREGMGEVNEQRKMDPHCHFFEQMNPGHARGDELCCIAPLTRKNFRPAAYRVIGAPIPGRL